MAAPIKHTCPEIDRYIKSIKQTIVEERYLRDYTEKEVFDAAVSMANKLECCIDYLESLRSSNEILRNWGKELTDELESAATYINDLENKITV